MCIKTLQKIAKSPDPLAEHVTESRACAQQYQIKNLKCHCNKKIFDPILNATEQHFHTSLNGVFSFSISCFVLEILRFFETCKLSV